MLFNSGVLTVLLGSAIFFGIEQETFLQELMVIVFLSLIGSVVPMIIGYMITASDPGDFNVDKEVSRAKRVHWYRRYAMCGFCCPRDFQETEKEIVEMMETNHFKETTVRGMEKVSENLILEQATSN